MNKEKGSYEELLKSITDHFHKDFVELEKFCDLWIATSKGFRERQSLNLTEQFSSYLSDGEEVAVDSPLVDSDGVVSCTHHPIESVFKVHELRISLGLVLSAFDDWFRLLRHESPSQELEALGDG